MCVRNQGLHGALSAVISDTDSCVGPSPPVPTPPTPPPAPTPAPPAGSGCCFYHDATCPAGSICCTSSCATPETPALCSYKVPNSTTRIFYC
jgi:hypothetical protein